MASESFARLGIRYNRHTSTAAVYCSQPAIPPYAAQSFTECNHALY